jgi:hypothetical protein
MDEAEPQRLSCGKEPETRTKRTLLLDSRMDRIGLKGSRELSVALDGDDPTQRQLGNRPKGRGLPAMHQFIPPNKMQGCSVAIKESFLLQLANEPKGAHHRNIGCGCQLGRIAVLSSRCIEELLRNIWSKQYFEHPLVKIGKEVSGFDRHMMMPLRSTRCRSVQVL